MLYTRSCVYIKVRQYSRWDIIGKIRYRRESNLILYYRRTNVSIPMISEHNYLILQFCFTNKLPFNPVSTHIRLTIPNLLPVNYLQLSLYTDTSGPFIYDCHFAFYGVMRSRMSVNKPRLFWNKNKVEDGCWLLDWMEGHRKELENNRPIRTWLSIINSRLDRPNHHLTLHFYP